MDSQLIHLFWTFSIYVIMLLIIGGYCMLATLNLVWALIGLEILMKAVTLLIIAAGYVSRHPAQAQALVITLIVIETVGIAIAMGIVLSIYRHKKSLDSRNIMSLKG